MRERLSDKRVEHLTGEGVAGWAPTKDVTALAREVQESRLRIAALEAAIDAYVAEIDQQHAQNTDRDLCDWCGAYDGGWPCAERQALDALKEARRG